MFWQYKNHIPKAKNKDGTRKKVFVGVSGGVDSSVSLALLKKRGFNVTGVFIKVYHPPELGCDWRDERLDAMKVCQTLGVPFLDLDLEKEYKQDVFDYMIETYRKGETPNPDVFCNKYVKFGGFWDFAKSQGADYVATGHYAARRLNKKTRRFELHKARDLNKDQSYFLYTLPQEKLAQVIFPVGGYANKNAVRRIAKKYKLFTSDKKDSQGLCFVGKVKMKDFLTEYIPKNPGDVLDGDGFVIGKHDGAVFYTLGERHGFEIFPEHRTPDMPRMFVVAKDQEANTITVGSKEDTEKQQPSDKKEITITNPYWTVEQPDFSEYEGRIRYRGELIPCKVKKINGQYTCVFKRPHRDVAKGQSLVLYRGNQCIGGGTIV